MPPRPRRRHGVPYGDAMQRAGRRRLDRFWVVLGALGVGAAVTIGVFAGDTERIPRIWAGAEVDATGQARIIEVIDYDFGIGLSRHGIFRDVPDLDPTAPISVSSPSAPDQFEVVPLGSETRLRIGDPLRTIRNRHRYTIEYPLDTLVQGDQLSWNAVGTDWPVTINGAEIHLVIDAELSDVTCSKGRFGARGGCDAVEATPGHWVTEVGRLPSGEGVTISGVIGSPLPTRPTLAPPQGPADDPGLGWFLPVLVAVGSAIAAGAYASALVRRLGREWVYAGGAAEAAFGDPDAVVGAELIDDSDLADLATVEFQSPRGLSAAAGGIIHAEGVESQHKVAWLIEAAIRDEVELVEEDGDLVLRRGPAEPHPAVAGSLASMFGGRQAVPLGSYDPTFGGAWANLGTDLEDWRKSSGLWDPRGRRRRARARVLGFFGIVLGFVAAGFAGVAANRWGGGWIISVIAAAVVAGASLAIVIRSWELLIRSPAGSARWLQIESFRRFLAASEAHHVQAAAEMGLLRHYTAWAVALGEVSHWSRAVEAAAEAPGAADSLYARDLAFVSAAPAIASATRSASTAPSSNGGGGGGGSVGGGGGGGGGGSW